MTVAPTCLEDGMTVHTCACSLTCQSDPVKATGHSYETNVIREASIFSDGETEFTCAGCGDSFTEHYEGFDLGEWILEDEVRTTSAIAVGIWLVIRIFRLIFKKKKVEVK